MKILSALFATVCVFVSAPASATTVDFAPLTSLSQGPVGTGVLYQEGGLDFASAPSDGGLYHWGTFQNVVYNADPQGATLFQDLPGEPINVTRTGGGLFTLNSFDLADVFDRGYDAGDVSFSWVDAGGAHSSWLTLDKVKGLQTFNLNLTNLTSFSLQKGGDNTFQVDNINFVGNGVPEPATWAMMILGFGAAGSMIRRRKAVVA